MYARITQYEMDPNREDEVVALFGEARGFTR